MTSAKREYESQQPLGLLYVQEHVGVSQEVEISICCEA